MNENSPLNFLMWKLPALMGRFWCSVIMLSEGFILIKSKIAALIQSVTQLELFWERSGACGSGVLEAEVVSSLCLMPD